MATLRQREKQGVRQPAGKLRGHEPADGATVEPFELPTAHRVKQHHDRGHLGQRHGAFPVTPLLIAALVEQTLRKQRLELLAEIVDRQKSSVVLSIMGHLNRHRMRQFCSQSPLVCTPQGGSAYPEFRLL